MHLSRTRFSKDIVCEFLPPKIKAKKDKVIIIASGMPGIPNGKEVMSFLASKGYWVFLPRYRGSWESCGEFLKNEPTKDIKDVLEGLKKEFTDGWSGKKIKLNVKEVFIFGSSFGGPAALMLSKEDSVKKVVTFSSIIDWLADSKDEPLDWLFTFIRNAFGEGYRFPKSNWKKLSSGRFYNPVQNIEKIDSSKVLMFHNQDDTTVLYKDVKIFALKNKIKLISYKKGGHRGSSWVMEPKTWKIVKGFIK